MCVPSSDEVPPSEPVDPVSDDRGAFDEGRHGEHRTVAGRHEDRATVGELSGVTRVDQTSTSNV